MKIQKVWGKRIISSARGDVVNLGPSLVCSVAKDVYFDKQVAEADQKKEETAHKHPKQS
jgi:ribulose kinase